MPNNLPIDHRRLEHVITTYGLYFVDEAPKRLHLEHKFNNDRPVIRETLSGDYEQWAKYFINYRLKTLERTCYYVGVDSVEELYYWLRGVERDMTVKSRFEHIEEGL